MQHCAVYFFLAYQIRFQNNLKVVFVVMVPDITCGSKPQRQKKDTQVD